MTTTFLTQCIQIVCAVFSGFPLCLYLFAGAVICSVVGIIRYFIGGFR